MTHLPPCTACGWPRSTGHITYGTRLREAHCEWYLLEWEQYLRGGRWQWMLADFRAWQTRRAARVSGPWAPPSVRPLSQVYSG